MTIYHESIGTGSPVLFIHAGIADSRMWDPQFESVPNGFRYVRVDLQGFGETKFGGVEFSNHDDVLAVMDHLSIDSAVLVGCSMGVGTVLGVAEKAPDRVAGMVLIGGAAPGFEPPEGEYEPPQWPEALKAFESGDMKRVAELDAEMWVIGYGRSTEDIDQRIFDLVVEMDQVPLGSEERREAVRVRPGLETLPKIDGPTLIVVGESDFPDLRAAAEYLAAQLSDSHAVVVEHAAHLPSLEQPDAFNRTLGDFLSKLE